MSLASDWAAAAAGMTVDMESMETARPAPFVYGGYTCSVNHDGTMNISGPSSSDLDADDALALAAWITATFGPPA